MTARPLSLLLCAPLLLCAVPTWADEDAPKKEEDAEEEGPTLDLGAAYTLEGVALAKLAFSHRRLGPSTFRLENTRLVSTGFSY
jgi:hypothetical protein